MGYTSGLYKLTKLPGTENFSFYDFSAIEAKIEYDNSEWVKKNNISFNDYHNTNKYALSMQEIEKYAAEYIKYNGGKVYEEIEYWCSVGKMFEEWFEKAFIKIDGYRCYGTKKEVMDSLNHFIDAIEMKPIYIHRAFIDDEVSDEIRLIKCDGVEVSFEDNHIERIYTTGDYGPSNVYTCDYDEDECCAMFSMIRALAKLLDLKDNQIVMYEYGW